MKTMMLYVKNLAPRTTNDDVRVIFHQFGRVLDVWPVREEMTSTPGRAVWVEMGSPGEAEAALHKLNGKDLNGLPLEILLP